MQNQGTLIIRTLVEKMAKDKMKWMIFVDIYMPGVFLDYM